MGKFKNIRSKKADMKVMTQQLKELYKDYNLEEQLEKCKKIFDEMEEFHSIEQHGLLYKITSGNIITYTSKEGAKAFEDAIDKELKKTYGRDK